MVADGTGDAQLGDLKRLRAALANVADDITLPQLLTLVTVALEPGLSINELAASIDTPQQSASRYASTLLGRYADALNGQAREPLLEQKISLSDPRKRALFLTEAGRKIVSELVKTIWPNTNSTKEG